MNINRVTALIKKEFIHLWRDPWSLGMALAIPILLLVLFGYALTLDVDRIPLVIWDQDKTPLSRDYINRFAFSRYFYISSYADYYAPLQHAIDTNKAFMALIIPRRFAHHLKAHDPIAVQLLVDGSDSYRTTIAIGYAEAVTNLYNQTYLQRILWEKDILYHPPIKLCSRVWFNPDLKSRHYIIPSLIAVIMMIIAALLTSLTVAKEWENGTMEQLISTPLTASELVLGKFIPYFIVGFFDMLIAVGMGHYLFHIPFHGSIILLFLLSSIFLTGALSLGLLISITSKNQLLASQTAMIATFLPAFLLSGFMYAIDNMPTAIQLITYLIPARYFLIIIKGIYLKGVGLTVLWPPVLFLSIFAFITTTMAIKKFKKKVV